jgi:hypothetical protein
MRKLLLSTMGFFYTVIGFCQNVPVEFQRSTPRMIAYGQLPEPEKTETVQAKFIAQKWSQGNVKLKTGAQLANLPLIFDVYSNKLYFMQDNQIMEFVEPVTEFKMNLIVKNDSTVVVYRSAYPLIQKNTEETFYEVLVDGTFQLLKCKAKTIHLYKDEDVPEERRDYSKELFYAFVPGGKLVLIKKDADAILEALPDHAPAIRNILQDKKIRVKNESGLKELFRKLNGD